MKKIYLNKKFTLRTANTGFTLIEIMLALFIFAIVALIATSALHNILSSRQQLALHSARLNQLQIAVSLLQQDLSQFINRPIYDNIGTTEPALIGQFQRIDFTRGGFINPLHSEERSNLQRVAYYVKDNNLIRVSWLHIDQTAQDSPKDKIILTQVSNIEFGYLDNSNGFRQNWFMSANNSKQDKPPRAIEVTITLQKEGKIVLLILITAGESFRVVRG
jgi:general secretion pathway protein J